MILEQKKRENKLVENSEIGWNPKKESFFTFTKEQLLTSKRYQNQRDLLLVLLEADQTYTIEEVDQKIMQFQKGVVE